MFDNFKNLLEKLDIYLIMELQERKYLYIMEDTISVENLYLTPYIAEQLMILMDVTYIIFYVIKNSRWYKEAYKDNCEDTPDAHLSLFAGRGLIMIEEVLHKYYFPYQDVFHYALTEDFTESNIKSGEQRFYLYGVNATEPLLLKPHFMSIDRLSIGDSYINTLTIHKGEQVGTDLFYKYIPIYLGITNSNVVLKLIKTQANPISYLDLKNSSVEIFEDLGSTPQLSSTLFLLDRFLYLAQPTLDMTIPATFVKSKIPFVNREDIISDTQGKDGLGKYKGLVYLELRSDVTEQQISRLTEMLRYNSKEFITVMSPISFPTVQGIYYLGDIDGVPCHTLNVRGSIGSTRLICSDELSKAKFQVSFPPGYYSLDFYNDITSEAREYLRVLPALKESYREYAKLIESVITKDQYKVNIFNSIGARVTSKSGKSLSHRFNPQKQESLSYRFSSQKQDSSYNNSVIEHCEDFLTKTIFSYTALPLHTTKGRV